MKTSPVNEARQHRQMSDEDKHEDFYLNTSTQNASWEPPPTGYKQKDGRLMLPGGQVISDPDSPPPSSSSSSSNSSASSDLDPSTADLEAGLSSARATNTTSDEENGGGGGGGTTSTVSHRERSSTSSGGASDILKGLVSLSAAGAAAAEDGQNTATASPRRRRRRFFQRGLLSPTPEEERGYRRDTIYVSELLPQTATCLEATARKQRERWQRTRQDLRRRWRRLKIWLCSAPAGPAGQLDPSVLQADVANLPDEKPNPEPGKWRERGFDVHDKRRILAFIVDPLTRRLSSVSRWDFFLRTWKVMAQGLLVIQLICAVVTAATVTHGLQGNAPWVVVVTTASLLIMHGVVENLQLERRVRLGWKRIFDLQRLLQMYVEGCGPFKGVSYGNGFPRLMQAATALNHGHDVLWAEVEHDGGGGTMSAFAALYEEGWPGTGYKQPGGVRGPATKRRQQAARDEILPSCWHHAERALKESRRNARSAGIPSTDYKPRWRKSRSSYQARQEVDYQKDASHESSQPQAAVIPPPLPRPGDHAPQKAPSPADELEREHPDVDPVLLASARAKQAVGKEDDLTDEEGDQLDLVKRKEWSDEREYLFEKSREEKESSPHPLLRLNRPRPLSAQHHRRMMMASEADGGARCGAMEAGRHSDVEKRGGKKKKRRPATAPATRPPAYSSPAQTAGEEGDGAIGTLEGRLSSNRSRGNDPATEHQRRLLHHKYVSYDLQGRLQQQGGGGGSGTEGGGGVLVTVEGQPPPQQQPHKKNCSCSWCYRQARARSFLRKEQQEEERERRDKADLTRRAFGGRHSPRRNSDVDGGGSTPQTDENATADPATQSRDGVYRRPLSPIPVTSRGSGRWKKGPGAARSNSSGAAVPGSPASVATRRGDTHDQSERTLSASPDGVPFYVHSMWDPTDNLPPMPGTKQPPLPFRGSGEEEDEQEHEKRRESPGGGGDGGGGGGSYESEGDDGDRTATSNDGPAGNHSRNAAGELPPRNTSTQSDAPWNARFDDPAVAARRRQEAAARRIFHARRRRRPNSALPASPSGGGSRGSSTHHQNTETTMDGGGAAAVARPSSAPATRRNLAEEMQIAFNREMRRGRVVRDAETGEEVELNAEVAESP